MENASKALIIAGAILLAILLITLGILVYNQAAGVINSNAMSDVEIQQFNQKFLQYEGDRQRGVTVRSLIQTVLANNMSADDADRKIEIVGDVELGEDDASAEAATSSVNTGGTYTITCLYSEDGGDAGLINQIQIVQN